MFRFLLALVVVVVVVVLDGVLENTVVVAFTATTPSIFSSSSSSSSDDTTIKGTTLTNNSITTTTTTRMAATTKKLICSFDDTDFSGRTIWPYTSADLNRLDNSVDTKFYDTPRLVTHIDDTAIQSLSDFYRETFTEYSRCCMKTSPNNNEMTAATTAIQQLDVLDLCSSWISHFPSTSTSTDSVENNTDNNHPKFGYGTVVGLGMNQEELEANPQLTRYLVQDLNTVPNLHAFDDASFDVVTMTVSIDYLIRPLDVVQEIYRVLKPSGRAIISFGDRCFATKAVAMWLQADPLERITIVASYFHYAQYQQEPQSQQQQDEDATTTTNITNNDIVFRWNSIECYDLKDEPQDVPKKPSMQALLSNPSLGVAWMNTAAAVQKTNNADPLFVIQAIK